MDRVPAQVVVVADDLTGANAVAGRFAERGWRATTVDLPLHLSGEQIDAVLRTDADVVVLCVPTRHAAPNDVRAAVGGIVEHAEPGALVCKRIDTTLRGNVGTEADAALNARAAVGRPARALVIPAYPAAGRTTVGGLQLVHGQPLATTAAGADPRGGVPDSRVASLLAAGTARSIAEVDIDQVRAGGAGLRRALATDAEMVVVDAITDDDIATIAAAAADLAGEGAHWLPVDPGPGSVALADALGLGPAAPPVLVVAGSVTDVTREQMTELERATGARLVTVSPEQLAEGSLGQPAEEVVRQIDAGASVVGITTSRDPQGVEALSDESADRVATEIGRIAREVADARTLGGIYVTGGDITSAVLAALDAHGLVVGGEIEPLAVHGWVLGGPHDGTTIATKGGLIGGRAAAIACVTRVRATARSPRAPDTRSF